MKFKSLESLRGIAAVIVALFHSPFNFGARLPLVSQGAVFVDFFFVLSGFIMAYAYADKIAVGFRFKPFFLLRVGRLYPLHLFMLVVWLPYILAKAFAFHYLGVGNDPFDTNNIHTFISNVFLVNSWGIHDGLSWNYPAWSISVELFAYITFYVIVKYFALGKLGFLSLSLISYSVLYFLTGDSLLATADFGILRCIGGFFLGVWLFQSFKADSFSLSPKLASLVECLVVLVAVLLVYWSDQGKNIQIMTFASFALVVFVFSVQDKGIISNILHNKWLLMLGVLSYSIYMIHAIVFAVAGNVWQFILKMPVTQVGDSKFYDVWYANFINIGCLSLVILLSVVTYKYIESPWREKFRTFAKNSEQEIPQSIT